MTSASLRALAVSIVLALELADALLVDGVPSKQLDEPGNVQIFEDVARALGTTPAWVKERVVRFAVASNDAHAHVRAILAPFHRTFRLGQNWGVFAGIDRDTERLRIIIGRGGTSRTLYVAGGDASDAALARLCDHRRISGIWHRNHGGVTDEYYRFVEVVARRVLARYPEADYVEFQVQRYPIVRSRLPEPSEIRYVVVDRRTREELR